MQGVLYIISFHPLQTFMYLPFFNAIAFCKFALYEASKHMNNPTYEYVMNAWCQLFVIGMKSHESSLHVIDLLYFATHNYANPVYGVVTVCHQVRCLRWGHPSLFHTTTSLLNWYKMLCVRDISYRLIWMEFINMFSVYAQSETHRRFNWWIIAVLTYNPSVLMRVKITDAPKL